MKRVLGFDSPAWAMTLDNPSSNRRQTFISHVVADDLLLGHVVVAGLRSLANARLDERGRRLRASGGSLTPLSREAGILQRLRQP